MPRTINNQKPSFFWQGLLILLPMVVLTGAGLSALRQDRTLAEQEAREQGADLAQRLARSMGEPLSQELRAYRNTDIERIADFAGQLGFVSWGEESGAALTSVRTNRAAWQATHRELDLAIYPRPDAVLSDQSGLCLPLDYPLAPQPPAWLASLSPAQTLAWQDAQKAEFAGNDLITAQAAWEHFITTQPPPGAQANAEYSLLQLQARQLAPVAASTLFVQSRLANSPELTAAGLPISQLLCFQALQSLPSGAGLSESLLHMLGNSLNYHASILSARLIAEADRVAGRSADGQPAAGVALLQAWWVAEDRTREVLRDFREQYPPNSWSNGCFWSDSRGDQFLLGLRGPVPLPKESPLISGDRSVWHVVIYPRPVWESALTGALGRSDLAVPRYASVHLEFAGKELTFDAAGRIRDAGTSALASAWLGTGTNLLHDCPFLGAVSSLRVGLSLTEPDLLYARQRQRTVLFGSLIAAAAIAAVAGFLAAWNAFRRQMRLSEMKSNFVSSVSHELRAPIASVRLLAEGLERGKLREPHKAGEYLRMIVQECQRLSALVENVLDFSRIEQGRKQYEFEPTDVEALARHTVALLRAPAAEQQITLALEIAGTPIPVELDGKAIQQALVNLLDNAIKHSPPGTTIGVGLQFAPEPAPVVRLWVEDQGEGIPAGEQARIFERFYRRGSELRRETRGVGIGLSIVQHIATGHGGRIIVRSAPGQGSRFTLELPAHHATASP